MWRSWPSLLTCSPMSWSRAPSSSSSRSSGRQVVELGQSRRTAPPARRATLRRVHLVPAAAPAQTEHRLPPDGLRVASRTRLGCDDRWRRGPSPPAAPTRSRSARRCPAMSRTVTSRRAPAGSRSALPRVDAGQGRPLRRGHVHEQTWLSSLQLPRRDRQLVDRGGTAPPRRPAARRIRASSVPLLPMATRGRRLAISGSTRPNALVTVDVTRRQSPPARGVAADQLGGQSSDTRA